MKTISRSLAPLTLLMAATLTLSACSQGETASFDSPTTNAAGASSPAAGGEGSSATGDAEGDDVTAQSAAAAGVDPVTVGEAIATATVPARVKGDPEATLEVSIHSLTRQDRTLVGIFSFTVQSTADDADAEWLYDYLGSQSWTPHLIDTVNLTRHDVLNEAGIRAMTDSQGSLTFRPGQTVYGYAAFASPPEDVTSMMVNLIEGAPAIEVELQ